MSWWYFLALNSMKLRDERYRASGPRPPRVSISITPLTCPPWISHPLWTRASTWSLVLQLYPLSVGCLAEGWIPSPASCGHWRQFSCRSSCSASRRTWGYRRHRCMPEAGRNRSQKATSPSHPCRTTHKTERTWIGNRNNQPRAEPGSI